MNHIARVTERIERHRAKIAEWEQKLVAIRERQERRAPYRFVLEFPAQFTIYDLMRQHQNVQYITLHTRVKQAVRDGLLIVTTKMKPEGAARGRPHNVYQRVPSPTTEIPPPQHVASLPDVSHAQP